MKLLLDTHIFLWYISVPNRLSEKRQNQIHDPQNEVYLSVVSIWETIIKNQLGKLLLPKPAEIYLPEQRERHKINSLSLEEQCVSQLGQLPRLHRDPFDRILICQAKQHGLIIVTDDPEIRRYPIICDA